MIRLFFRMMPLHRYEMPEKMQRKYFLHIHFHAISLIVEKNTIKKYRFFFVLYTFSVDIFLSGFFFMISRTLIQFGPILSNFEYKSNTIRVETQRYSIPLWISYIFLRMDCNMILDFHIFSLFRSFPISNELIVLLRFLRDGLTFTLF